jgi:hypothetical protein
MDSNSELAIKLGLKPYAEFEQIVSPVLARVSPKSRSRLLREIYGLAARKVLMDGSIKGAEEEVKVFRQRRRRVEWARTHIQNAWNALLKAESRFPQELPRWFNIMEMMATLGKLNEDFARAHETYLSVENSLKNLQGNTIEAQTSPATRYTAVDPGMKSTASDYWFISEVNKLLAKGPAGRRPRVWPNKLIQQAFKAAFNDHCTIGRIKKARKRLSR